MGGGFSWSSARAGAWRGLIVLHRYLGVAVGLVMTVWCLSGFVMMYSGYPRLTEAERLRGLSPLRFDGCCAAVPTLAAPPRDFRVEMLAGRPVLRQDGVGGRTVVDLRAGTPVTGVSAPEARAVAEAFVRGQGVAAAAGPPRLIDQDQWTVQGAARRGPVWRVAFDDPAARQVYVARATGEVVQWTTRSKRFWGWLGAVPHWLYPTLLRQDGALWSEVVIWTSTVGVFLTATGLYVGAARLKRYRSGRWSPYRGWFFWHHMTGLAFGVLTLAWVTSGLLTMGPWGLLDSEAGLNERAALAGRIDPAAAAGLIAALPGLPAGPAVALKAAPLDGRLFVTAHDGRRPAVRLDGLGRPAPLAAAELDQAIRARIDPQAGAIVLMTAPDDYNYDGYDRPADLPAYRVALRDPQATTLYLDPASGAVVRAVDRTERLSRWTRTALHDWDFPALKKGVLWDIVVLPLLAGVTAVCALGAWLGWRRIVRDAASIRSRAGGGRRPG